MSLISLMVLSLPLPHVSDKIFATIPLNTLSVGFIEYDNQKSIKIPTGSRKPDEAVAVFLFDAFVFSFMLRKQL